MPVIQRVVKPKTQRGRRELMKRAPLLVENARSAIMFRGPSASDTITKFMKNVTVLKKPNAVYYSRKHDWRPMEDSVQLEELSKRQDASLFMFGSHNKKRPHNVIVGRMHEFNILDMVELGIENFKGLDEFKTAKVMAGVKPCLLFAGDPFENVHEYQRLKSLLIDFFVGEKPTAVRLAGLEHVIMFTAVAGKVHMRSYKIQLKKSGTKLPRVELEEIGPHADLLMRRTKLASEDLYKRATRQSRSLQPKVVKNIRKDKLGSKLGRIHMQKQDIGKLQTRKGKALRKSPEERKEERKAKVSKKKRERKEAQDNAFSPNSITRIATPAV